MDGDQPNSLGQSSVDRTGVPATLNIQRTAFTTRSFLEKYKTDPVESPSYGRYLARFRINRKCLVNCICRLFPVLKWLPEYKPKEYIVGDVVAGLTVGIFCIPQSMAFSLTANLAPVYGLYVALFPVIIYILMGTSHHLSVGTFAIVSIMAANAVEKTLSGVDFISMSSETSGTSSPDDLRQLEWLKAHTALCMLVGIIQVIMGILRLGFITMYLSTPILRGFTTGAACHIFTSQFKYLFGLEITAKQGPVSIVYVYIEILSNLRESNLAAITVSIVSLIALVAAKELMQLYKNKFKVPIPIELIVVAGSITGSYYLKWNEKHGLPILGNVPTGIPSPSLPPIKYFYSLLTDAFVIAVVAYVLNISQAMIIARKNDYRVNSNQEFIAYGCGNVFASFFSCFTNCGALGRTLLLDNTGGKTQLASFVQCILLFVVLLSLGPLFEPLPQCVLGCIVMIALTGMFRQFADIKVHWKARNWCDLSIWLVTWSTVTFIGVDVGLVVGVSFSFVLVVVRTQRPQCALLGEINNTGMYKEIGIYDKCKPVPGFKIFQMRASLYFANADYFKEKLVQMTELNSDDETSQTLDKQNDTIYKNHGITKRKSNNSENGQCKSNETDPEADSLGMGFVKSRTHTLIIDCGSFSFLDSVGVATLDDVINRFSKSDVTVVLADCKEAVFNILDSHRFFKDRSKDCCFPSIHDAIVIRKKQHAQKMFDQHNNLFNGDISEDAIQAEDSLPSGQAVTGEVASGPDVDQSV